MTEIESSLVCLVNEMRWGMCEIPIYLLIGSSNAPASSVLYIHTSMDREMTISYDTFKRNVVCCCGYASPY